MSGELLFFFYRPKIAVSYKARKNPVWMTIQSTPDQFCYNFILELLLLFKLNPDVNRPRIRISSSLTSMQRRTNCPTRIPSSSQSVFRFPGMALSVHNPYRKCFLHFLLSNLLLPMLLSDPDAARRLI